MEEIGNSIPGTKITIAQEEQPIILSIRVTSEEAKQKILDDSAYRAFENFSEIKIASWILTIREQVRGPVPPEKWTDTTETLRKFAGWGEWGNNTVL